MHRAKWRASLRACVTRAAMPTWVAVSGCAAGAGGLDEDVGHTVQQHLEAAREGGCPGLGLAVSCGNRICDVLLGENTTSCASDCEPALFETWYEKSVHCAETAWLFEPRNTAEVQDAVRQSVRSGRRVRVVGSRHSSTELICGDGSTLITTHLNAIHGLESFQGETTVLVDAGVTFGAINDYLAAHGYALGYGITTIRGVSVGGALGTAVHGSSPVHSASFSSSVRWIELVTADGAVREYREGGPHPEIFAALRANLGLLGVITRVRLRVVRSYNLRIRGDSASEADLLSPTGATDLVAGCDYGDLHWFPGSAALVRQCAHETSESAPVNSGVGWPDLLSALSPFMTPLIPASQAAACEGDFACFAEELTFRARLDAFAAERVDYGPNILSVENPDLKVPVTDWAVTLPARHASEALAFVRERLRASGACLPFNGIWIRFDRAEPTSLLGMNAAIGSYRVGEPLLHIVLANFDPYAFPPTRRASYDAPLEEIVRVLLEKHEGRLHWGKNRTDFFAYAAKRGLVPGQARFQAVIDQLDPYGVFGNDWAVQAGFTWPHAGEDFSEHYYPGSNPCGCSNQPALVCVRTSRQTFVNACRAACAGTPHFDLLEGACHQYVFGSFLGWGGMRYHTARRHDQVLPAAVWR